MKPIVSPPKPQYEFDKTYVIRLRKHCDNVFPGLWDLDMLNRKGDVVKVVAQADNLNIAIENMTGEIENDGY